MNIEIKAVMFDIGGVLSNNTDPYVYGEAARVFGVPRDRIADAIHKYEHRLQTDAMSEREFWQAISAELGAGPVPDQAWDLWFRVYEQHLKPNRKVFGIAGRLRAAGYRTGILSNTEVSHVRHKRGIGFFDGFDPVILSCEVGLLKPGREIFRLVLERLGLPASQTAYTDDNENKLDGARELGIRTHVFKGVEGLEKWLKGLGLKF